MNDKNDQNPQNATSYQKPVLRRFPLRAEEAILGFCKSGAAAGPNSSGVCTIPTACNSPGS